MELTFDRPQNQLDLCDEDNTCTKDTRTPEVIVDTKILSRDRDNLLLFWLSLRLSEGLLAQASV